MAVFFDVYFFDLSQILIIVTMILMIVTAILASVINVSIIKLPFLRSIISIPPFREPRITPASGLTAYRVW